MPNFFNFNQPDIKKKGLLSGFLLGFLFGLALGPCTFAFMAPILGIAFSSAANNFIFSFLIQFFKYYKNCIIR